MQVSSNNCYRTIQEVLNKTERPFQNNLKGLSIFIIESGTKVRLFKFHSLP